MEREGRASVIHADGELDAFAAPDLDTTFEAVAREPAVVADLSRVSFMDSTALGLVVRAVRQLGAAGGGVRVVLPDTPARRIFEITTLDRVLPICASRSEALAELEARF